MTTLFESIPWESLRSLIEQGYTHERKSNAGRKRIDPLILFKMLVLQQLFNLSDDELEFQVNDSTVLSSTYEPKGWKPAVDRLSMPRLCLSPSREIPEQRIKPSWKASFPRDGKTSRTPRSEAGRNLSKASIPRSRLLYLDVMRSIGDVLRKLTLKPITPVFVEKAQQYIANLLFINKESRRRSFVKVNNIVN